MTHLTQPFFTNTQRPNELENTFLVQFVGRRRVVRGRYVKGKKEAIARIIHRRKFTLDEEAN